MSKAVLDALRAKFGAGILATSSHNGEDVALITRDVLLDVARFLRDDPSMQFALPCYCTCIDYLGLEGLQPFLCFLAVLVGLQDHIGCSGHACLLLR